MFFKMWKCKKFLEINIRKIFLKNVIMENNNVNI